MASASASFANSPVGRNRPLATCPHVASGDRLDIALPARELLDLARVGVEAQHRHAGIGERPRERQADIAKTDDADDGPAPLDPIGESRQGPALILHCDITLFSGRAAGRPAACPTLLANHL